MVWKDIQLEEMKESVGLGHLLERLWGQGLKGRPAYICVCGGGWGVCPRVKGSVPADWDCVLASCEQVPAAGETEDPGPFTGWTVCLSQVTRGL